MLESLRSSVRLVVLVLLVLSPIFSLIPFPGRVAGALTAHSPISVSGDSSFTASGFPGSGTATDPYRIENLEIDLSQAAQPHVLSGISITGTSAHFLIKNVYVHSGFELSTCPSTSTGAPLPSLGVLYADFNCSPRSPTVDQVVEFNARAGGGRPYYLFNWNFGDGSPAQGSSTSACQNMFEDPSTICTRTTHSYSKQGQYTVTVTVSDTTPSVFTATENVGISVSGITLKAVQNGIIQNSVIANNLEEVRVEASIFVTLTGNTITAVSAAQGLLLDHSFDITVSKNQFSSVGIFIAGDNVPEFDSHTITSDNTVNGKALYYYNDCNGLSIDGGVAPYSSGVGELILANCTGFKVSNLSLTFSDSGCQIAFSTNGNVTGSTISSKGPFGFLLESSSNNTFTGNTVYNSLDGFDLVSSTWNTFTSNIAHDNEAGFSLTNSSFNTLTQNLARRGTVGFSLDGFSNYNSLVSNEAYNNLVSSFSVSLSLGNSLASNTGFNNTVGFSLLLTAGNTLVSNVAYNDFADGFGMIGAVTSSLRYNTAFRARNGFSLSKASNNTLSGNMAHNDNTGFALDSSNRNVLAFNVAYADFSGFSLSSSANNTISGNVAYSNTFAGYGAGFGLQLSSQNTLGYNTAYNNDVGFSVDLFSASNVLTHDRAFRNSVGFALTASKNLLSFDAAYENTEGFGISGSATHVLFLVDSAFNNTLPATFSTQNAGFSISDVSGNAVTASTIYDNPKGIQILGVLGATDLFYNNFLSNTINAVDTELNSPTSYWNTTKTAVPNIVGGPFIGGNFWSDYQGSDPDGDGLGDTPYVVSGRADYLPLVIYHPVTSPSFALIVPPVTIRMGQSPVESTMIALVSLNGFADTVTLSATVSGSNGPTASFKPATLTLGAGKTTTSTVYVAGHPSPGTYTLNVTATGATVWQSVIITVVVPDFSLTASSTSLSIPAGGTVETTLTASSNTGFAGPVILSTFMPDGFWATWTAPGFVLGPADPSASTTLTLTTRPVLPPGTYKLVVQALGYGLIRQVNLSVTVVAPAPSHDFSLTATPSSMIIQAGSQGTATITVTSLNGFSGTVGLVSLVTPQGLPTSLSVSNIPGGSGTSLLTITPSSSTPLGLSEVTVVGTSGSLSHLAKISVSVTSTPPPADFSIDASPRTVTVQPGGSPESSTITLGSVNSFAGTLTLSAVGSVLGISPSIAMTASLSARQILPVPLTITVDSGTQPGSYGVVVTATGGQVSHTVSIAVVVPGSNGPDFKISASPSSLSFEAGSSEQSTVTITSLNGFAGTVMLSDSISPASGLSCSLSSNSLTLGITASTNLSCSGSTGTYIFTVKGVSGQISRMARIDVSVTAGSIQTGFEVSVSPSSLMIIQGGTAVSTVTVKGLNGFTGTVNLSVVSASGPKGVLSVNSVSLSQTYSSATSTLTVTVPAATPPFNYNVTITGRDGSSSHSGIIQVTVKPTSCCQPPPQAGTLILGLVPSEFYLLAGSLVAVIVVFSALMIVRGRSRRS